MTSSPARCLLVQVRGLLCALPLEHVAETMRPLAVRAVPGAPPFVSGAAVIRGVPVPVVDAAVVLGLEQSPRPAGRFVTLRAAGRRVAFAVDQVRGVRDIDQSHIGTLPPLLRDASAHVVAAVGTLDAELLVVLQAGRMVPEDLWPALAGEPGA